MRSYSPHSHVAVARDRPFLKRKARTRRVSSIEGLVKLVRSSRQSLITPAIRRHHASFSIVGNDINSNFTGVPCSSSSLALTIEFHGFCACRLRTNSGREIIFPEKSFWHGYICSCRLNSGAVDLLTTWLPSRTGSTRPYDMSSKLSGVLVCQSRENSTLRNATLLDSCWPTRLG